MRSASAQLRRPLRQRIQVTSLDAMCRMIDNGLGVGIVPDRAFTLMHGVGNLRGIQLTDDWAHRELRLMARDFDALPVTARLLVEHLSPRLVADALAPGDDATHTIRALQPSIGLGAL
ncbi:LysR substrate binding domain protein [compost metagenome]